MASVYKLIVVAVASVLSARVAGAVDGGVAESLRGLERALGTSIRSVVSPHTGAVTFLSTPKSTIAAPLPGHSPAERARAFLRSNGRALKLPGADETVVAASTPADETGIEHVRLRQTARGLPVRFGEMTVHLSDARIIALHAKTITDADQVDTTPTVSAASATAAAAAVVREQYRHNAPTLSAPELELFNRGLIEGAAGATRLAWLVTARAPMLNAQVWIDAHDGGVLFHLNHIPDAQYRIVYDRNYNLSIPMPGQLVGYEEVPPSSPVDAVDVFNFSADTHSYYLAEHGRDSFDGAGAPMVSTVRFCDSFCPCPCSNAYWNGSQTLFGLPPFTMDDVVAHEWTHGVTQYSAGLIYYQASGALNESFSDIFGETVDLTNSGGYDPVEARWLVSESAILPSGIRNMTSPETIWGDPPRMGSHLFYCGPGDSGGVHSNSGVANHAYALMVDGGTYNGFTVTGIGLSKAAKIQYRSLTQYLTPTSGFSDNYDALLQSCSDLIGVAGISAADCSEVQKALDAVEMYAPWPCTCGNGTLDAGEQCDDGNRVDGDCCSSICYSSSVGDPCSDNDACTQDDACQVDGGDLTCVGTEGKRNDCRGSVAVDSAKLSLKDTVDGSKDQLSFSYSKGLETPKADFGFPTYDTDYTLCLFREIEPTLLRRIEVPGGTLCGSKPCWKAMSKGFKYKDTTASSNGIVAISLKEGETGRTRIALKGKGVNLLPPAIGELNQKVTAQLISTSGVCWDAEFAIPAKKMTDEIYKNTGE